MVFFMQIRPRNEPVLWVTLLSAVRPCLTLFCPLFYLGNPPGLF